MLDAREGGKVPAGPACVPGRGGYGVAGRRRPPWDERQMTGMVSALTRAIWSFILLSGGAVIYVAATDDPRVWPLLSERGFAGLAAASLVIGWLIRARRKDAAPERSDAPKTGRRGTGRENGRAEPVMKAPPPPPEPEPARPVLRAVRETPKPARVPKARVTPVMRAPATVAAPVEAQAGAPEAEDIAGEAPEDAAAVIPDDQPAPEHPVEQASEPRVPVVEIRIPPASGDAAVDRCFDVAGLGARPDTRRWQNQKPLVEARRLRLLEDPDAALARLAEIRALYPDFEPLYVWTAEAFDRAGRAGERDSILAEGLDRARSKAAILAALGAYAAGEGRLGDAVENFVRSAALQLGGGGETASWAFLDLAALSEPHARLAKAGAWLYAQADRVDQRGIRHDEDFLEERRALSRRDAEPWMLEAIETLWRFYGAGVEATEPPEPRPTPRNSPLRAERHRRPPGSR